MGEVVGEEEERAEDFETTQASSTQASSFKQASFIISEIVVVKFKAKFF